MPNIGPMIAASAHLGIGYAERLLEGIPAEKFGSFARSGETVIESNHPAFICGHLSLYPCRVVEQLGEDAAAHTPSDDYTKLFSHEATCVDDPGASIYPAKDELVEAFLSRYRAAASALENAEDDLFNQENPRKDMIKKFPSVGAIHAFYMGGHTMMHLGQLSAWRRAIGLGAA